MKMIEALKGEMKNSLKEVEEKTSKKWEEVNKSLKENKGSQEKKKNQTGEENGSRLEN